MKFFDVCTKLNNQILTYYDLRCTYEIKPLQINYHILQSSKVFSSKVNRFLIIFTLQSHQTITLYNDEI